MGFTNFYIYVLYSVVIICSSIFYLNNHYIIASLLFLGNIFPGYKLGLSLSENYEN